MSGAVRFLGTAANLTVCAVYIAYDLSDGGCANAAVEGIFDAYDMCCNARIGVYHLTVDELQIFAVAKRLSSDYTAVFENHIFAVPCHIFAFDDAVV